MIDGATQRRVSSSGVELAAIEAGDAARPTLVFIHGYPDTKELWKGVLERLAPRFHVVAYDVRGAGASSAPRGPAAYDFERLQDDLEAVIDAFAGNGDAKVHLVGHDWGGIQGWTFASSPRLEGKLASFTTIAGPSLDQVALSGRAVLARGNLLEALRRGRRSWYVLTLCTPGGPTLAWRAALAAGRWQRYLSARERVRADPRYPMASLAADGRHGSNLYRRNIPRRMLRPRRDQIARVPVQLIVPSDDHFISEKYYERAERHAPTLRRRTVAGSHWAPRTQPEMIARWIGEFVDEVEGGAAAPRRSPWVRGGGTEQLNGRLALVTGAGSGIGRATSLALAARGVQMLLVDLDGDAVACTAEAIPGSHHFTCDVSDPTAMEQLAVTVLGKYGVPHVVVNNAGIAVGGPFLQTELQDWRRIVDVNLMGVVHGCRFFAPAMVERGEGGQIVNTASAAAFQPSRELSAYAATKAAVLMLSECLRAELVPAGIGVTAVCPGIVATNITRVARYVGRDGAEQARIADHVTRMYQKRNFTPEQVATEIIDAIATDKPVAVVTPEAKVMRALSRFAPGMLRRLAAIETLPI